MRVVLVHLKDSYLQWKRQPPWLPGVPFLGRELGSVFGLPAFASVKEERYDCGGDSRIVIFAHANDTADWSDGLIRVGAIEEYYSVNSDLLGVLPFSEDDPDRSTVRGNAWRYGPSSIGKLLTELAAGLLFNTRSEIEAFLRPPIGYVGSSDVEALSILCQAFLAVTTRVPAAGLGASDREDIDRALRKMGWYEGSADLAEQPWVARREVVRRASWWMRILPQRPRINELGAVKDLLDSIYGFPDAERPSNIGDTVEESMIDAGQVARAYLQL